MELQKLSTLLNKWRRLAISHETIKKEIIETIHKKTGVMVNLEKISTKNNILSINESPGVKSVIFIHKQQILEALKEKLGNNSPTDIR
ncbi:MAG: hypothetical protein Q7S11_03445 [bacterium]|nr:hypothetical protein [bacterium]